MARDLLYYLQKGGSPYGGIDRRESSRVPARKRFAFEARPYPGDRLVRPLSFRLPELRADDRDPPGIGDLTVGAHHPGLGVKGDAARVLAPARPGS